ncbi:portal protein [Halorubrum tailed virus 29]|uniref:Portal protein n=1 Tax=Halorubrum tailed virus 29 TaxID=2878010 RepID=A0AAE8Y1R2_9CAUD|nr:portal protein [Halorubrum tailed virus 29]UBF23308.1 portal protein [Halorubrum tailed virus 29]
MSDDDAGFFRNLGGLARDYVVAKRRQLQDDPAPETAVDSTSAGTGYSFSGQEIDFEDLRDIKDMRESGGQVAQLMDYKALLNFGEGAELHVEENEDTEEVIDGEPMTLEAWLETQFPRLDLTVLDLGSDALWYPAAVGELRETQAGDFKEFLPAEPWTVLPVTNDRGEIVAWKQQVIQNGTPKEQTLNADVLCNIVLNKQSARDKTGISEVLRNDDEIQAFKENEQAINNAIELHGFPQRHVKVGREEGTPVRDDDLRRVRTLFDPHNTDANTAYFTGQGVDVESLEAENFDYQAIHEMDMRNLTTALGLPLEAGNVGADGLGSGKPAELRFALLKLAIKANQRSFSTQFIEKVVRPVIRDYSPFDHTATVTMSIDDPLEDIGETADLINSIGDYMTNAEARRRLDLPEPEDDEVAESYRSPADIERDEEGVQDDPMGGLFNGDGKTLAEIPDKYTEGTGLSEDDFVPNADVEAVVDDVLEFIDAEGLPNPENQREGAARANQLKDHAANDDPLAVEFWEEISNFHARHRAQGNHECDKSDLPEAAAESDFDGCYFDAGYFSDKTWGGDPGKEQADRIVEAIEGTEGVELSQGDTDFRCLGEGVTDEQLSHAPEWDRPLLEMFRGVSDPNADPNRALVSFAASETPEFVLERIREAIMSGATFSHFEGIDDGRIMEFRQTFADALGTDDFTLDSMTEDIMDFADLGRDEAERIARTESSAALNKAREIGYEEQGEGDARFYWTGADPGDSRQTEACEWLIRQTNPFHGGDPVPMEQLRDMVEEAPTHDDDMANTLARPESWVVHPNERSTFALAPESGI